MTKGYIFNKPIMSEIGTEEDLEVFQSSFEFHNFHDQFGEVRIYCQIIQMEKSLYLWVGNYNEQNMKDLALAFPMDRESKTSILSTKIMGPIADEVSTNLASRLSKKLGKPVYVSFNVAADNMILPIIERRIHEEFKKYPKLQ